jgi:hypothetical protein
MPRSYREATRLTRALGGTTTAVTAPPLEPMPETEPIAPVPMPGTDPQTEPAEIPPLDPSEPIPNDPGPLLPDTPETLPPPPVEPSPDVP